MPDLAQEVGGMGSVVFERDGGMMSSGELGPHNRRLHGYCTTTIYIYRMRVVIVFTL